MIEINVRLIICNEEVHVHVNVVTPSEPKLVCGKSNKINGGRKYILCSITEKKLLAFDQI